MRIIIHLFIILLLASCATDTQPLPAADPALITVIGTNDVHGELLPADRSGGLTTFSGYVHAIRTARAKDGGAVLLIDAGDM